MSNTEPVAGYRPLTEEQVELANRNKLIEELVLRQVDSLMSTGGIDHRFASIAHTHFQEGFMALNRAIFQPQRIDGPIDTAALFEDLSK